MFDRVNSSVADNSNCDDDDFIAYEVNRDINAIGGAGIIAEFFHKSKIGEALDSLLPKTRAHKVTVADAILAIILNFLCPPSRPIYLTGNALHKFNIPKLFDKQLSITDFNDDVLLRALDAIATYGTSEVYCKISECIVDYLGLKPDSLNMDSTSFHVHCDPKTEEGHIQLTHGYSRDFRPDLPQIVQMLVVDTVSKVPVFMKNIDGNQPDTISFKFGKYVMQQLKAAKDCKYLIADSALCTDDIISDLYENNILFITRCPRKIKELQKLIAATDKSEYQSIKPKYTGVIKDFNFFGKPTKLLLVKSEDALKRTAKGIDAHVKREAEKLLKEFQQLKKIEFACKKDALAAYSKLNKGFDYVELPEITEEGIEEKVKKVGRGRPKKATSQDDATQQVSKYYMVTADVEIIIHEDVILEDKADGGVFAIMTNDVNKDWDMADLLGKYQSQQSVERGFRFLKDPEFFADSFFLKHPERLDALLMIMAVTLAIYSGIEYMIRAKLKATNQTLPNQLGKEIQNPTFRWLLMPLEQLYIRRMPDGRERLFCYDETFGGICVRLLKLLGTGYMNRYR
jgi:transposase